MSGNHIFASAADVSTTTNTWMAQLGTRRGDAFVADWVTHAAFEGRLFAVNTATGTTPDTFNAAYAAAEQDLYLYVPSTVIVIPVALSVGFEDTGTAAVVDVVGAISSTADAAVTGTAETIRKVRTDSSYSSSCTATSVVTSGGTDPTSSGYFEFFRPFMGIQEDAFNGSTSWINPFVGGAHWSVTAGGYPPIVSGGGSVNVYAGAQAGTGFITLVWAEFPSSFLT